MTKDESSNWHKLVNISKKRFEEEPKKVKGSADTGTDTGFVYDYAPIAIPDNDCSAWIPNKMIPPLVRDAENKVVLR